MRIPLPLLAALALPAGASLTLSATLVAQQPTAPVFTHADTLRGALDSPGRAWWDLTFYDLKVAISPADSSIKGSNAISWRALSAGREMQIDLMTPLEVDSVIQGRRALRFRRDGNAFFVTPSAGTAPGQSGTLTVYYHGKPRPAKRPPWDGGFTWGTDSLGRPWIVTTDQGVGASIWWPNKDQQADEPDSQHVAITVPAPLQDVSNGRLRRTTHNPDGTITYEWAVVNPINNYAIAVAAGNYAHYSDTFQGEKGTLTLDYWPLDYHLADAQRQFPQSKTMLSCFEHWFGPYPWYEDGYKLIEVSNNGMEHQSAVAYGNLFANGYRHRDLSGTGLGLKWDFIIIHESAHEWFGNNITGKDRADMWVHESFANYAEGIYTECLFGKDSGAAYTVGSRRGIRNDKPIIPAYGVNAEGSGDMYPKGGNMLHTIRQIVNDDEKWRGILRGLNSTFWHQTVTSAQVENYISAQAGVDLSKVFQQYLTDTRIPWFEYWVAGDTVNYHWAQVVPGFDMPVRVTVGGKAMLLHPTEAYQSFLAPAGQAESLKVDQNFYVVQQEVSH